MRLTDHRGVINVSLVLGLCTLLTFGMFASMSRFWRQPGTSRQPRAVAVSPASVTAAAVLAGLDAESLLAAGVTTSQFATIAGDAAAHVRDHPANLADRANGPQAMFTALTASLTDAQRASLQTIRANRQWKVPAAYKLVERTPAQWVTLRDALADEAIAATKHHNLDRAVVAFLAGVRAQPAVANALQRANNAASTRSAWTQAAEQGARR